MSLCLTASFVLAETSVADRRRMFELAASRAADGAHQNTTSRTDLRQLQHDALAEYVERKKGLKREEGQQRSGSRPRSAYIPPENSNQTGERRDEVYMRVIWGGMKVQPNVLLFSPFLFSLSPVCHSDTGSLSSTSSLLSLQDSADRSFSAGERRVCSTLPPGIDLRSFESNVFYPGRVTTPRPPAHSLPR